MYSIFSTPLICCSMGAATVSATTCALAPGYEQFTCAVGGAISGYCATGRTSSATPPAITRTIDSTDAKIGWSMKNRANIREPSYDLGCVDGIVDGVVDVLGEAL